MNGGKSTAHEELLASQSSAGFPEQGEAEALQHLDRRLCNCGVAFNSQGTRCVFPQGTLAEHIPSTQDASLPDPSHLISCLPCAPQLLVVSNRLQRGKPRLEAVLWGMEQVSGGASLGFLGASPFSSSMPKMHPSTGWTQTPPSALLPAPLQGPLLLVSPRWREGTLVI